MKKLLSLALALIMVLSLSVAVFADDLAGRDDKYVDIAIKFEGTGTVTAETFNYVINDGAEVGVDTVYVTDSPVTDADGEIPEITIDTTGTTRTLTPGQTGNLRLKLPTYNSVGVYYYTVTQTPGNTAGVEYDGKEIIVKVTVVQQADGKINVAFATASLADVDGKPGTDVKTATFVNTYSAGSLAVKKLVTGNLGDRDKEFNVTVTFTAPANEEVKSVISYTDGTTKAIETSAWTEENGSKQAEVTIALNHNETVTFTNIPYGVTYIVTEEDYASEGYEKEDIVYSDEANKKIDADTPNDTVTITNTKNSAVDTGIVLDSLPYVLLIAVAVVGVVIFTSRKRTHREY